LKFTNRQGLVLLGEPNEKMSYQWTSLYFDLLMDSPPATGDASDPINQIEDKIKGKDTTIDQVK